MSIRLRRGARLAALLSASLLVAAACGNSDDDDTAEPETTEAPADGGGTEETTTVPADDGGGTETSVPSEDGGGGGLVGEAERDTFVALEGVPGVSDEEIAFVSIATGSNNPLGTCVQPCFNAGIKAYFEWRNSEGGIYGRQLVLAEELDDELAKNLDRAQEVIASDSYFAVFNATQVASGWGALNDAGIPTYVWGIHANEEAGREYVFPEVGVGCFGCTSRAAAYIMSLAGGTVAGVLGYGISENSKVCAQATADSIERYSEEIGGATVGYLNDNIAFGLPNGIGPEVTAMKDAGVDYISTCMDLNGMKTLAEELQRQGMDDVVLYHPNTYDQEFVANAGGVFDGDYVGTSFIPFEYEGNAMAATFQEWMENTGERATELSMKGWLAADQMFTALLAAGPEFDQEKLVEANNSFTEYDAGGLIVPIDWTRQHNPPTQETPQDGSAFECVTLVRIVDGAFETVHPADKPWACWSNQTRDWSEPEYTSFG